MLFKFLSQLGDKRLTFTVRAKSEKEARQNYHISPTTLCVARYSDAFFAKKQAKMTACEGGAMSNFYPQGNDIYQENLEVIAYLLEKAIKHSTEGKIGRMLNNVKSIQVIAQAMIEEGELNAYPV